MIPLPPMLMHPLNPLYTDAQRKEAWERYEVDCWAFALRHRGLRVQSLTPEVQRALIARIDEGRRRHIVPA